MTLVDRGALNPSPSGILSYQQPVQYQVRKTGYYCVGECVVQCEVRNFTESSSYCTCDRHAKLCPAS